MKILKRYVAGLAMAAAAAAVATPASAIVITRIQIKTQTTFLQVAEVVARGTTATDYALAANGATATASPAYSASSGPGNAIDGNVGGSYYTDGIYHSASGDGTAILTINLAAPTNIEHLTVFGREDGFRERDLYTYTLFDAAGNAVATGTLDARTDRAANVDFAATIPEPAAWGMMILGMGAVGVALRRRVRVSECRFDARIARMTAGDIA